MGYLLMLIGKKYGTKMKTKFFIIFFLLFNFSNLKADINNLDKNYIPLRDFIILKFDLFIERNLINIFRGGGITGVKYQNVNYKAKFKKNNNLIIAFEATMDKKRYKSKKYFPKVKDCNQLRNKIFTNKYGYSLFSQKLNNLVNEDIISGSINEKILNITSLNNETKKKLLEKTEIKISILHPNNERNIVCYGKISDIELKIM